MFCISTTGITDMFCISLCTTYSDNMNRHCLQNGSIAKSYMGKYIPIKVTRIEKKTYQITRVMGLMPGISLLF